MAKASMRQVMVISRTGFAVQAICPRSGSELSKAANDPAVMKRADADGLTLRTGSRAEIQKLLVDDSERLGRAVRRLKIKAE